MAFGFLIEKFDLFVSYIGKAIGDEQHFQPSLTAELVGVGLFLVGVIVILVSTTRFFIYKKAIESDESIPYSAKKTKLFLSTLMISLALFLLFYMSHQIFS